MQIGAGTRVSKSSISVTLRPPLSPGVCSFALTQKSSASKQFAQRKYTAGLRTSQQDIGMCSNVRHFHIITSVDLTTRRVLFTVGLSLEETMKIVPLCSIQPASISGLLLHRNVSWASVKSPDSHEAIRRDELLFLEGEALPLESLLTLIRSARNAEAAAVCVVGASRTGRTSTELLMLADRLGLPIFDLGQGASPGGAVNTILQGIIERQQQVHVEVARGFHF